MSETTEGAEATSAEEADAEAADELEPDPDPESESVPASESAEDWMSIANLSLLAVLANAQLSMATDHLKVLSGTVTDRTWFSR